MAAAAPSKVLISLTSDIQLDANEILLDASINEMHVTTAQVTDHQVETGSNVTDHIRPLPRKLTLEAFITNTPIAAPGAPSGETNANPNTLISTKAGDYKALQFDVPEFDRVKLVYGVLTEACAVGAICTITTSLRTYQDFAIINLSVPRNAQNGNAIQFTIDLQELRFVDTQVVAANRTARKKPGAIKKRGAQPAKPVTSETQKSALKAGVDFIKQSISGLGG